MKIGIIYNISILIYFLLFGVFIIQFNKNRTKYKMPNKITFIFVLRHIFFCLFLLFFYSFLIYLLFEFINKNEQSKNTNLIYSLKKVSTPIFIYLYLLICMNHWYNKKNKIPQNIQNLNTSNINNKYIKYINNSYNKFNSVFIDDILDFTIIKTETTGIRYDSRLVEFAAIKIRNGIPVKTFQSLINPLIKIPKNAIEIHGISNRKVKKAPTEIEISSQIYDFVSNDLIVGHNIEFDIGILKHRLSEGFSNKSLDIIPIFEKNYKLNNYKLNTIIKKLELLEIIRHRALHDAFIIMKCINKVNEDKHKY